MSGGLEDERYCRTYQGKESKCQRDKLIDKLDMQKDFSSKCMICTPNLTKVDEGVYSRKESTIEPSPALRNEFRNGICD